jgi:hypothetical protein
VIEEMKLAGNKMRRLMLTIFILLAIAVLSHSQALTQLSGVDGVSLLENLTNTSVNMTEINNTTVNLSLIPESAIPKSAQLSGADGTVLLENLTGNSSSLMGANNSTGNLDSWGSKPRDPPLGPSLQDIKDAKLKRVIRDNHIA